MPLWKNISIVNPLTGEVDFVSMQMELNNRLRYYLSHIDLSSLSIGSTGSLTLYSLTASTGNIAYLSSTGSATFNVLSSSSATIPYLNTTGDLSVDKISFSVSPTTDALSEGQVRWSDDDKTLNIQTEDPDVTLQVGQEMYLRVTNKTTQDLSDGELVYINGAQGNRPTIDLALATTEDTADTTIAMVTHSIPVNNTGYVTTIGLVRDIDTSSFVEGDTLYLSSTTPGGFVNVKPSPPNHAIKVGYVVTSAVLGKVLVSIHTGSDLKGLHDVSTTSLVTDNVLVYSSSSLYWYNTDDLNLSTLASSSATITDLEVTGTFSYNASVDTITSTTTLTSGSYKNILCKPTGAITVNLSTAITTAGTYFNITNGSTNSSNVTVDAGGTRTIHTDTGFILYSDEALDIYFDGTSGWWVR